MAWFYLIVAGLCEIGWAIALKYSRGFTQPLPSVVTLAVGFVSFYLLSLAAETIPIGSAYAVWTGIGAVGTVILGMILFAEPRNLLRLACILLVVAGIIGLRVASPK